MHERGIRETERETKTETMPETNTAAALDLQQRVAAKSTAALTSVLAASGVTLLKLLTGVLTGSLGMLSEAAHSGIDLIAAAITLWSVRVSDQPADEEHNYGHGKVENLSAVVEVVLMVSSCGLIGVEAVRRMLYHTHLDLRWSVWPFLVLLLSIAVDFGRARALRRTAAQYHSEALQADAVHFGTDIWASLAVLLGLSASFAGERLGLPWLEYADPVAALLVAAIILFVTFRLARKTIDSLLDATPAEVRAHLRDDLRRAVASTPDVLGVERIRIRRSGSSYFVDLGLELPRNLTFQRAEQVTSTVTEAVEQRLPGADVTIRTVPTATLGESVFDRVHAVAARSNLAVHDLSVQEYNGTLHLEQHLEVPETMPLRDAHEIASNLEAEMRREVPAIRTLLTHIESEPTTIGQTQEVGSARRFEEQLHNLAAQFPELLDIHEVTVTRGHGGGGATVQVNCHCTLPDELPMSRVHEVITELEGSFRLQHPEVSRVLIHPEPATDNCR